MRILLIEDDRALCTALLPALQAAGYTVDTCHAGAAAGRPRQGMYHPGVNADGPVRHQ